MRKKLAVVNIDAHGHVNPTLPVTAELVRRGVDVLYLVPDTFRAAVEATGARHAPFDSVFVQRGVADAKGPPQELILRFPLRLVEEAEVALPGILERLAAEKPDAVIYDVMCLAGRFAAQILGIPAMTFRPTYVANEHFNLAKHLAAISDEHPLRVDFRARMAALAARYGVEALSLPELFSKPEPLNVVFMPRAFQPAGDTFDATYAFVGPQIAPRPAASPWVPPAGGDPLLFISLGTVFNDWPEFFGICFEAFGGKPWRVLAAIGDKVDPARLGTPPANFTLARHVPQLEVLPHASVFVTHGGMNSVQESIWFGKPMVVIPQMLEQAQSARRVEELGLGKALLERSDVDSPALAAAVAQIAADPSFARRVAAMRENSVAAGGYQNAADLVEAYLKR